VRTVLSGPAGGLVGAAAMAGRSGFRKILSFDMGGTSCDVCVVDGGEVREQSAGEIAGRPLALPMLAVHTVGAGGGSIAWRDPGGALRVGPRSAGADPGPACYGRGGTEATVTSFTAADCRRHLRRHYQRRDLVVSIAGALDTDRVAELVSSALAGWPVHEGPAVVPLPAADPTGAAVSVLDRRAGQANIVLGARAPSYRDERRFTADILNVVLGEGMSSRLFLELREERALAYDVHSFLTRVADSGTLAISLGCEPKRALVAIRAAVDELRRLATDPVPAAELERAKEYARGRLSVQLESTSALCNHLGQQELLTGEILLAEDIAERLVDVDAEAIRSLAADILGGGLRAAVIGPFRKPDPFLEALSA